MSLVVNEVRIGPGSFEERQPSALAICDGLLRFLPKQNLKPEATGFRGYNWSPVASFNVGDSKLTLGEFIESSEEGNVQIFRSSGIIWMTGELLDLSDWSSKLMNALGLFALLLDQPIHARRVSDGLDSKRTDLHVSWPETDMPPKTFPLATFEQIGESALESVFERWNDLNQRSPELTDRLIDFQAHRNQLTHPDRILLLTRSLETFHVIHDQFESVHRSPEEHNVVVDAVRAACQSPELDDHADWITNSIKQANRRSFGDQMRDVLEFLGEEIQETCSISEPDRFVAAVRDTRNFFTHPSNERPKMVPEPRGLVVLTNQLWFVLRACVLIELGFSRTDVSKALTNNARRHYVLS